jgi:hypothetical protein
MGAKEAIKWNGMTGLELFFRGFIGCALGDSALPLCGFCLLSTIYDWRLEIGDWRLEIGRGNGGERGDQVERNDWA